MNNDGVEAATPTSAHGDTLLSTDRLTKRFGAVTALDSVSIQIGHGITGLVGANGAGKTTLMSILLGIYQPTSGEVNAFGFDPGRHRTRVNHRAAFVPERNVLPDELKAIDYVEHLARVKGIPKREAKTLASDSLFLVGIGEERFRPLGTMSTGQRQRVKLAQAIAASPELILLDEPTAGLDPAQRHSTLDLISSVAATAGMSFLISSHLLDEIERVCGQIVALDGGRLVAQGPINQILNRERADYRIEFGDAMSSEQLGQVGSRIQHSLPGTTFTTQPTAVDPTLVVKAPVGTPTEALARACRDAVALEQRRLRFLGPNKASLRELFADLSADHTNTGSDASDERTGADAR